jgi:hypothetical protein
LRRSLADLRHPAELRELGTALFLDRPLGAGKLPGMPDATPLLSYEAFSRSLAERRLQLLSGELEGISLSEAVALQRLLELEGTAPGIPLKDVPSRTRPGVVALADAHQVAEDFVFLRTTPRTVRAFLDLYDFTPLRKGIDLDWLTPERSVLILGSLPDRAGQVRIVLHDGAARRRLELTFDAAGGYASRGGVEYAAEGLRLTGAWHARGEAVTPPDPFLLRPR